MARSVTFALLAWLLPLAAVAQTAAVPPPAGTVQTPAPAPPPGEPQTPVFRAGVDVIPIDVTVVDGQGRQVKDIGPAEFQVEVNGKARRVISAEYMALTSLLPATEPPKPARFAGDRSRSSTPATSAPRRKAAR